MKLHNVRHQQWDRFIQKMDKNGAGMSGFNGYCKEALTHIKRVTYRRNRLRKIGRL